MADGKFTLSDDGRFFLVPQQGGTFDICEICCEELPTVVDCVNCATPPVSQGPAIVIHNGLTFPVTHVFTENPIPFNTWIRWFFQSAVGAARLGLLNGGIDWVPATASLTIYCCPSTQVIYAYAVVLGVAPYNALACLYGQLPGPVCPGSAVTFPMKPVNVSCLETNRLNGAGSLPLLVGLGNCPLGSDPFFSFVIA